MSIEIKLLPCPFCGGEASTEDWEDQNTDMDFSVGCNDAECMGHETFGGNYGTPEQAAAAWNRRAPQPLTVIVPELPQQQPFYREGKSFILAGIQNADGIQTEWLYIWDQIERWYGDIHKRETAKQWILRMQSEIPYRDPKPLLDAMKIARPKIVKLLTHFGTMDAERDPLTELDPVLKAWEERT